MMQGRAASRRMEGRAAASTKTKKKKRRLNTSGASGQLIPAALRKKWWDPT